MKGQRTDNSIGIGDYIEQFTQRPDRTRLIAAGRPTNNDRIHPERRRQPNNLLTNRTVPDNGDLLPAQLSIWDR